MSDFLDDFYGNNAVSFLGIGKGHKNRERLELFYHEEGLEKPAWFSKC